MNLQLSLSFEFPRRPTTVWKILEGASVAELRPPCHSRVRCCTARCEVMS
ncbi:unnamed protein product [Periconia digitata]|uniref:Uncharacterized protein n=1 Tax=Periconia digitata TaxID=1303443 RepID=A0A9W4XM25_9PLEO|nr:unnamed protein product [Periconia digitata]